ncbi:hypothetical protein [Acidihalobacter ferrooxydans]|uniref:YhdP central domain-containing protein n=1 Tax=Acidihalobacter ferrooxydans TaxID=1765967 RepID=A0A1P8UID9_9GAMM|nr:hypothetical protein [Acidihalobacter ferrooxydans]APZ43592.1 hypothetical protein BW247_11245 [Acidihalobacter ferrooxydans]
MRRVLRGLFGKLWLLAATTVILAAVVTVAARQLLPMVPQYRIEIEQAASAALHRPVRIAAITVGWDWLSPQVRLRDVRLLKTAQGPVLLRLGSVSVGFDVLASVLQRRLVPDTVALSGVHIKLTRDARGACR